MGWIQHSGYRISLNKKFARHLLALCALSCAFLLLTAICYAVIICLGAGYAEWILLGLYPLFTSLFTLCTWKKSPTLLNFTPRAVRLLCALTLVFFLLSRLLIFLGGLINIASAACNFGLLFLLPALVLPASFAALILIKPVENIIAARFICKAKRKLDERQGLIRIGVTGSYGKTSVKNMLAELLGESAYATPASYNTPMGICRAVNDMPQEVKYFICEMGARRPGDIAELCGIVRPRVGVITGIAPQHIQTFKTLENVIATKGELIDNLPCNGIAVFNGYDEYAERMCLTCPIRRRYMTKQNVHCENVRLTAQGSAFTLVDGAERAECSLSLIGLHNIQNFCLAAQVCIALGMSVEEVASRAVNIKPVPHRLELIDTGRGITVIDDGYNSNVRGAKAALDALNLFPGRKIVAAQGFAEAGSKDAELNMRLGEQIAEVADIAILIGVKAKLMEKGLIMHEFPQENIYIESSLERAQVIFGRILRAGDTLLIENDLPENV